MKKKTLDSPPFQSVNIPSKTNKKKFKSSETCDICLRGTSGLGNLPQWD